LKILAQIIGWFVLIPFCLAQAWEPCWQTERIKDGRPRTIDRWSWAPLNRIYGNPEDGVSGQHALIWVGGIPRKVVPHLKAYRPNTWPPLRAWLWSAWRNSANQLNYPEGDG
jgi:hypothetical protein